jgi:hypothetical protein
MPLSTCAHASGERKVNLRKPLPDGLRETYDNGQCMYLAVALHQATGLPIEVSMEHDAAGPFIGHAYVVDGETAIDGYGRTTLVEARTCHARGDDIRRVDISGIEQILCPPDQLTKTKLEAAHAVVDAYYVIS